MPDSAGPAGTAAAAAYCSSLLRGLLNTPGLPRKLREQISACVPRAQLVLPTNADFEHGTTPWFPTRDPEASSHGARFLVWACAARVPLAHAASRRF